MDRLGVITLQAETSEDVRLAGEAARLAGIRLTDNSDSGLESCAYQLVRMFNIVEQMGLRVAKAFENHIDDERGWHAELIHRLSIAVPGVRPRLYPPPILSALRDLRGFRHIITHSYDLSLDRERIMIVVRHADELARSLPKLVEEFFKVVTANAVS